MVDFSLGFGYNAPKKAEGVHAMREFIIGKNDAGQRVDRFLSKAMPHHH